MLSSLSFHLIEVDYLEHRFMVLFHVVSLVVSLTVNFKKFFIRPVAFRTLRLVLKFHVRESGAQSSRLAVCVTREHFGECVAHFELAVRNAVHWGTSIE